MRYGGLSKKEATIINQMGESQQHNTPPHRFPIQTCPVGISLNGVNHFWATPDDI
jgi:hypothetical protein